MRQLAAAWRRPSCAALCLTVRPAPDCGSSSAPSFRRNLALRGVLGLGSALSARGGPVPRAASPCRRCSGSAAAGLRPAAAWPFPRYPLAGIGPARVCCGRPALVGHSAGPPCLVGRAACRSPSLAGSSPPPPKGMAGYGALPLGRPALWPQKGPRRLRCACLGPPLRGGRLCGARAPLVGCVPSPPQKPRESLPALVRRSVPAYGRVPAILRQ